MSRAFFDPVHGSLAPIWTLLVSHVKTAGHPPFESGLAGMGGFMPNSQKGGQGGFNAGGKPRLCEIPLNPHFTNGEAVRLCSC